MKSILLFVILHFANCIYCQLEIDSLKIHDYHVHVFSERLIEKMQEQLGSFADNGFEVTFPENKSLGDVSRILSENKASKMLLISAGYAYSRFIEDEVLCEAAVQRENDFLAKIIKENPDRLIGFYGIDPRKSYSVREIKRCHFDLGLHGIKLHLQGNGVDLTDSIQLLQLKEVFHIASQEGIPLLIHNNASNLGSGKNYAKLFIEKLLHDFENLTIIFAHGGGGGLFFNFQYDFLKAIKEFMINSPNSRGHSIYFELSGNVDIRDYPGERSMDELAELIKEIGEDRFLFGTDYPYRVSNTYIRVLEFELKLEEDVLRGIIERDIFDELK